MLLTVFQNFSVKPEPAEVTYSEFVGEVQRDLVQQVSIDGLVIHGKRKSGEEFKVIRPPIDDPKLMDDLISHGVQVIGEPASIASRVVSTIADEDPWWHDDQAGFTNSGSCISHHDRALR